METEVLSVVRYDENFIVDKAVEIIKKGGLVAIPTETVYGLAGNAFSEKSVKDIYIAKGRPSDNPMIVHISEFEEIYNLVEEIPQSVKLLADKFWPGPLTVIMKKSARVPLAVTGGLDTVAIRMPKCDITRKIIKNSYPLAAPSANISGRPSPTSAEHVVNDLDGKIPLVIDAGPCKVGVESTVITFASDVPVILRPGFITKEDIEEVIGEVKIHSAVTAELKKGEQATSPGMKYKHYAPNTKVILLDCSSKDFIKFVNINSNKNIGAICFDEERINIIPISLSLGSEKDKLSHIHNLYARLRECDELKKDVIYARIPDKKGIDLAFYNRIIRAAAHCIEKPVMPFVTGLTGGSGAGKTEISEIFKEHGYKVINADDVSRKVVKDKNVLNQLEDAFGSSILSDEGNLDRQRLAQIAFSDSKNTERLNEITHPAITNEILNEISNTESDKILLDAPLLIESGLDKICDVTIGITADYKLRTDRIVRRDKISEDMARLRLSAGKSDDYYKENCTIIINNGIDFKDTEEKILTFIKRAESEDF